MAYNALNNLIDAYIYANGVQAITGQILNGVLKQMVSQLGSGYHLMGVATPETVPEQNDFAMAYFAATAGEYTDFGGITLTVGEVAVLLTSGNGSWSKQTIYNIPTGTADLENTANFITNAVADLVNYYTKTEIDGQKSVTDAALADRYTKSETDTKLGDYYRKTETYDKDEVDSIIAALSRQEYIVAWDGLAAPDVAAIPAGVTVTYSGTPYTGTLAASASTVNKIYMVWNGTAYDMYGTSQDGGYSWVPMGTTTVDLSQYATKTELRQVDDKFSIENELVGGTYYPSSANTSAACAFVNGKKYTIRITWSYTSGYCAYVAVRKYSESLVRVSSNYYNASGSDTFEYTADDNYTAIYVVSGGSPIEGTIELSVAEKVEITMSDIITEIDEVRNEKIPLEKLEGIAKGATTAAAKCLGYIVEVDNLPTYTNLQNGDFIAPIPIGAIIKNNGVKVGLFSDISLTTRHDMANGETWTATFEVNVVRTLETSGNVRLAIDTRTELFNGMKIDGETIKKDSVNIDRLSFVETGTNIYNKDADPDFAPGKYLNQWGGLYDNSTYDTSGFIKVEPESAYSYTPELELRFVMEYDENFQAITSTYSQNLNTFVTSQNTRYVRVTFYASVNKYFLCKGVPKPYEDFKIFIPSEYLQTGAPGSELPFFLPKHIYVANGRTIEIYYNQVLLNADRYNIQATCLIGKALERKFQIIGDSAHVGNTYTLSLVAYNDAGDVVASGTSTIHIVSNTISASKNVLPVGDSLTNGKPWLSELHTLSANLNTVGTRQGIHEGRSGANVSTYTNVSGGIVYDYDNQYSDNTVPVFDASASYGIGDKVKIAHTFGNGTSGYRYWVFKQAHSPGAFVESEAYCYSGGNPFYDYVNDKISFSFYRSFFGINYDAIILFLGTNGINLEPETNPNGALGIKNLIESIREDEPTTPILVINTIFRSNQNGIGNQGNTDGYVAQSAYKFNEDKKVLLLAKAVDDLCGSMSNVYLCPVGFTHDSKYNFGNNKVQVNPRLTSTDDVYELQPNDSVHPQTPGYMQMADEMFSTLCAIFGS